MKSLQFLRDSDADVSILNGKTVAILGYGNQGRAQAQNLRDSGVHTIIGVRSGKSAVSAAQDGFETLSVSDAVKRADIIHILLPDERQGEIYKADIEPFITPGKTLCVSHGFAFVFGEIVAPEGVDAIMVSPKGPGTDVRSRYLAGSGLAGLIAVKQDASGNARSTALALACANGFTRAGVLEVTMEQETHGDLFGEQNVLCGGLVDLARCAYEVLTEEGYPPEVAYFECYHEVKLLADLMHTRGIAKTNEAISNTAEWGEYVNGPLIIDAATKERMRESLRRIRNGSFAKDWLEEAGKGTPNLFAKRKHCAEHPIEEVGARIRKLFE
ncbi:MAG: ketol-acid reductoisomerase [Lentisphaeria bacterium]|nr:ketol-acid reductoisomerase [Lentisphaeria bacterium]